MTDTTNPLDPVNFHNQNVLWIAQSCELLKTGDLSGLMRDIVQCAVSALGDMRTLQEKQNLSRADRLARKRLHHTLQVAIPAWRRCRILVAQKNKAQPNPEAIYNAAARVATFLLRMVAQSTLFPESGKLQSTQVQHDTPRLEGLAPLSRSLALTFLREHAELFGPPPAWVEPVVVYPVHMCTNEAIANRNDSDSQLKRRALRAKIINLGVLTADEEQLLMRLL